MPFITALEIVRLVTIHEASNQVAHAAQVGQLRTYAHQALHTVVRAALLLVLRLVMTCMPLTFIWTRIGTLRLR